MIVVAIIGMLAVIAIPSFFRARAVTQLNICLNNLRQIGYAKDEWALATGSDTDASPSQEDVGPYLKYGVANTFCPLNQNKSYADSYTIGNIVENPACNEAPDTHRFVDD